MRRKIATELNDRGFDLIFLNGFELSIACVDLTKKIPAVLVLDTTPALGHQLITKSHESTNLTRIKSRVLGGLTSLWCRRAFRHIKYFLPISQWCADSLIRDYGIDSHKVIVSFPGIDLEHWKPSDKSAQQVMIQLLFVGNDFKRKGGDFLMDIYSNHLKNQCELTIISKEPLIRGDRFSKVKTYSEIPYNKLLEHYNNADIFVFPTWRDQLPMVILEAMAAGLAVVARSVGGIPDVVKDGYNGFLMPYDSTQEQWAAKIKFLINNPEERIRMGQNSRKLAEEKFSMQKFEKTIRGVIDSLVDKETLL